MTNTESTPPLPADGTRMGAPDWQVLLAAHGRWLRTVVYARVGEPQAVDEVMQEVALAAVRQKAPLRDAAKAAPWLYRLAVRQSLMYRRKQGRRRRLTNGYTEHVRGMGGGRQADPLAWLLADERRRLVRSALGRLPRRDAEMLLLKYSEDWSYLEMAEHLGTTSAAVQSRLHRARSRLRSELAVLEIVGSEL
jgi:RNA polymerase sigma-70 factor (ECF subfamily)